jgi:adenylylsulfate kinase-like enzyme
MVIWLIGLSGSGKTTLADKIVSDLREVDQTVVSLDGDILRELWGNDLGHDLESRRENAQRICRLCQFLDQQGLDVVCAILSIFPESREWCRQNLSSYYEVFIDAPLSQVMERDVKGIYSKYKNGEIKDVAGLDLEFPIPQKPDLVIKNVKRKEDLLSHAPIIKNQILRIK